MERKHSFTLSTGKKLSQKLNGLLGVWVGISFSGLLIWNGIVGMPSQLSSCTFPYPGSEANISLLAGDTLCIPPGEIFKGRVEKLPKGAHIKVYKNAIFHPIGLWDAKGSIENQGLIVMEDVLDAKGLQIDNKGKIEVLQAPSSDAKFGILNRLDAEIRFMANVSEIKSKFELQNYGDVHIEGNFRLGNNCKIENNGKVVLQEEFVIDGQISNFGIVHAYENLLLSKNANIFNYCSLISPNIREIDHPGFQNSGSLLKNASHELEKKLEASGCASRFKASKPIILQYFSSRTENGFPSIKWQVEKGSRASFFELERSFNKETFKGVGRMEASVKEDYIYKVLDVDIDNPAKTKVYYRLRMVNLQGKVNYSPILELVLKQDIQS